MADEDPQHDGWFEGDAVVSTGPSAPSRRPAVDARTAIASGGLLVAMLASTAWAMALLF